MVGSRNDDEVERLGSVMGGASYTMHGNFKVFARAIYALNKIGEVLYLEPNREGLALRSLNCSKSAYAAFLFSSTFFASCNVEKIRSDQYNLCRISMKPALMAFKCAKTSEKAVLSCRLFINPRADTMLVQLTHTYDVVKSHEIPLLECTTAFRNIVDKSDLANHLAASSTLLLNLLVQIRQETADVTISATKDVFALKNYTNKDQDFEKLMKTEVKIPICGFDRYSVSRDANVTVNLKELKAFVVFAEQVQTPVTFYFEEPGSPVVVALESDVNFTAELVVATVDHDCSVLRSNYEQSLPVESQLQKKEKRIVSSRNSKNSDCSSVNDEPGPSLGNQISPFPHPAGLDATSSGISFRTSVKKQRLEMRGHNGNTCLEETSAGETYALGRWDNAGSNSLDRGSPPARSKKFRQFFLSSSQCTMNATQLFMDKTIIVPDSDGED